MKLCQESLRLDIRKRFFYQRMFGYSLRLPKTLVPAPSLPELKKHLDIALKRWVGLLRCPEPGQ